MASRSQPCGDAQERSPEAQHSDGWCGCVGLIDAKLAEYSHAIVTTMFGEPKVVIETYRTRKGARRAPKVLASYCPFCGHKYGRSEGQ